MTKYKLQKLNFFQTSNRVLEPYALGAVNLARFPNCLNLAEVVSNSPLLQLCAVRLRVICGDESSQLQTPEKALNEFSELFIQSNTYIYVALQSQENKEIG